MSFSIAGKTAIVTGAANGVGLAIARHFAQEGANVVFADLDEVNLTKELGAKLADEGPVRTFVGDLREKLTVANLLSTTIAAYDRVDILVNATRELQHSDPLNCDEDQVEPLLQQNLMTPLRVSQAVARRMVKQREEDEDAPGGVIVNVSSIAAQRTHANLMGFSIASAALNQETRSLAVALAPHKIRVNAIALGSVMTQGLKSVLREDEGLRERIVEVTPLSRIASPTEVVQTVQYLASDASSFVTGQILTVDGGRMLVDAVPYTGH